LLGNSLSPLDILGGVGVRRGFSENGPSSCVRLCGMSGAGGCFDMKTLPHPVLPVIVGRVL
jgi:hypothetical protein